MGALEKSPSWEPRTMNNQKPKIIGVTVCDFAQEGIDGRYSFMGVHSPVIVAKQTGPTDFATISVAVTIQPLELTARFRLRVEHESKKSGAVFSYDADADSAIENTDRITFHHDISVRHLGFGEYVVLFGYADGDMDQVHAFNVSAPPGFVDPRTSTPKSE